MCTPWYEPFGMVALEAMACARPVVASSVGGLLDTVLPGVTGLHVPPRDPSGLATALRELVSSRAVRGRYGFAGRKHVVRSYSWPAVARATAAVYRDTIAGRDPGPLPDGLPAPGRGPGRERHRRSRVPTQSTGSA